MSRLITRTVRLLKFGALAGIAVAVTRLVLRRRRKPEVGESSWPTIAETAARNGEPVDDSDDGGADPAEAPSDDTSSDSPDNDSNGAGKDESDADSSNEGPDESDTDSSNEGPDESDADSNNGKDESDADSNNGKGSNGKV